MIKAGIIGTGNIGADLLLKILKTDFITPVIFAGRRLDSDGIKIAQSKGIPVTEVSTVTLLVLDEVIPAGSVYV